MAIIAFGNTSTTPGEAQTATLTIAELTAAVIAFDGTELYYDKPENWKKVTCIMKSEIQQIQLKFGPGEDVTTFHTSAFVQLDTFKVVSVILQDFDGGKFRLPISPVDQDSMSMEVALYVDPAFKSTLETTGASETLVIGTSSLLAYKFDIVWEEGEEAEHFDYIGQTSITHVYTTAGTHAIAISKASELDVGFPYLNLPSGGVDADKLRTVTNLGSVGWISLYRAFYECDGLTSFVSGTNTMESDSMVQMLSRCDVLTTVDLAGMDITHPNIDMSSVCNSSTYLESVTLPIGTMSANANLGNMFFGCFRITALDFTNLDTSAVEDFSSMCAGMTGLTTIVGLNTDAALDMHAMFASCNKLADPDCVAYFNMTSVTDTTNMFESCGAMTHLNLSTWSIPALESCDDMFYN